ncbi:hypothetical protein [Nostoc sp.]|uniref:hypothetical protein n=1 Tax=Nostoc sp. TaxID=1180 RepID=UPI003FA5C6DB
MSTPQDWIIYLLEVPYGKTSFCQLWAAQVAQELYPTWMPVLIRLRDVKYGKALIETQMPHLLGILHRDRLLDDQLLQLAAYNQNSTSTFLLQEISHRLSRWLLGYPLIGGIKTMLLPSGSAHIHGTPEAIANLLAGRHPQDLLEQMQAIGLIESCEGTILPVDLYDDDADDETVFGNNSIVDSNGY